MDSERIIEIFKNQDFIEKMKNCKTEQEKIDLLREYGIIITLEEYQKLEQIISEDELDNVSGGLSSTAKNILGTVAVLGASGAAIWGISKYLGKDECQKENPGEQPVAGKEQVSENLYKKSEKIGDKGFSLDIGVSSVTRNPDSRAWYGKKIYGEWEENK